MPATAEERGSPKRSFHPGGIMETTPKRPDEEESMFKTIATIGAMFITTTAGATIEALAGYQHLLTGLLVALLLTPWLSRRLD